MYEINIARLEKHPRSRTPRYEHWGRLTVKTVYENEAQKKFEEVRRAFEVLEDTYHLTLWKEEHYQKKIHEVTT